MRTSKNIMVCIYNKPDVLILGTRLSLTQLKETFYKRKVTVQDMYEVEESDIGLHIFEPLFADDNFDRACLN